MVSERLGSWVYGEEEELMLDCGMGVGIWNYSEVKWLDFGLNGMLIGLLAFREFMVGWFWRLLVTLVCHATSSDQSWLSFWLHIYLLTIYHGGIYMN